ncbi:MULTISPECIES: hypothetical protein [Bacillus cereus group]|uniref:Lipoprotein n=1 Tax=Bacillus thuringiensis serovar mexicanensis TaxID=180868 RepID=A0A242W776_BACTU|nr:MULTISPECIES: hypothetical protein [Bacillus cereus group]EEM57888.1 hypothetical protein bthur0007_43190 [Bacillus thuringiensis serovar monterrey BGSC 4AJ1]MEB9668774.1 hypothetical protein [Bacillus anthracis]OTW48129.1 hypothetical protein BK699_13185 [Bacillus thuringiensis serovar mexicanensis]OTW97778.1 hypothetical protein BK705_28555 [Bacillus thuringiensis serovar monterrey]
MEFFKKVKMLTVVTVVSAGLVGCGNNAELEAQLQAKDQKIAALQAELKTLRQEANMSITSNAGEKVSPISIKWENTNIPSRVDKDGFKDLKVGMSIEKTYRTLQREAGKGWTSSDGGVIYEFSSDFGYQKIRISYKNDKMISADYQDNKGNHEVIQ